MTASSGGSPLDSTAAMGTSKLGLGRLGPVLFAARGITPVGYAAFAFVLGVIAGVLVRRTRSAVPVTTGSR